MWICPTRLIYMRDLIYRSQMLQKNNCSQHILVNFIPNIAQAVYKIAEVDILTLCPALNFNIVPRRFLPLLHLHVGPRDAH